MALPVTLGVIFIFVTLAGLVSAMPWAHMPTYLLHPSAIAALGVSLRTCFAATVVCVVLGVPMAIVLSRLEGRVAAAAQTIVTLPMVLPPVVSGLALLMTFGRRGLVGQYFEMFGIEIGFTQVAVIFAQTFVSLPYLVQAVETAARTARTRHSAIAATLGASPSYVWWHVTLPMLRPAIASGTALAFARCLGEFGATITFAGSLEGITRTLPLAIYLGRETDTNISLALALVLLVMALVVVWISSLIGRDRKAQR